MWDMRCGIWDVRYEMWDGGDEFLSPVARHTSHIRTIGLAG